MLRSGAARSPATPLERIDRERIEPLPLSFAQQRLWFLEQMEGELTAYNMPFAWRLRGSLNTEALRRAFEAIVGGMSRCGRRSRSSREHRSR